MRRLSGLLVAAVLCGLPAPRPALAEEPRTYEGLALVSVLIESQKDLLAVSQLGEMLACSPRPGLVEFMIDPAALPALRAAGLPYVVRSLNVQELVDAETLENEQIRAERGDFFSTYRTIGEINSYLTLLGSLPGLPEGFFVQTTIGTSIQGRPINAVRITGPMQPGEPQRPVFLITATQHAREWASTSSIMWIIDRLVREYGSDPFVTQLVDNVDFRFVPVVNPDGYNHTFPTAQGGGGSRLWRKNRRLNSGGSFGVDLNRNWATGWGGSGSSGTQSSDTYRGAAAFSEPETAAVRDYANALPNLKGYIDIHTYSQLVLGPWGYTTAAPPRQSELNPLTNAMIAAITSLYGGVWTGGPTSTTLYIASGTAPDWTFATLNALSWTYELRDRGAFGFQLPASQIVPAAQEAYAGIVVLAQHIQIRLKIQVTGAPSTLDEYTPAPFGVSITTENLYTLAPGSAALHWRASPADPFSVEPLTGGPVVFTATIPPVGCGRTVEYFVQASANDGFIVRSPSSGVYTAQTPVCTYCPGDANGDGVVNFADLSATLANWGTAGEPGIFGDADNNGTVDFADLSATLAEWGRVCD